MAILLGIGLLAVLYLYGRSVATTFTKSIRELGIYLLVLLSIIGLTVLFISTNSNL
ncbi:MAG: hypothetical protein IPP83_13480 [Flavobacteriales bacterium]|nr:hypothetical protein [Flavobacteriales bacterium]